MMSPRAVPEDPQLAADIAVSALEIAIMIRDPRKNISALTQLFGIVPGLLEPAVVADALSFAEVTGNEMYISAVLAAFAPHLDADQRTGALQTAKTMTSQLARYSDLAALAADVDHTQGAAQPSCLGSDW